MLSAFIAGGLALLGGVASSIATTKANQANIAATASLQREQNAYNQQMTNALADYNKPINQVTRYKQAGINPALAMSSGGINSGSMVSAPQASTAQAPTIQPNTALGNSISSLANYVPSQKGDALQQANTSVAKEQAQGLALDNVTKAATNEAKLKQLGLENEAQSMQNYVQDKTKDAQVHIASNDSAISDNNLANSELQTHINDLFGQDLSANSLRKLQADVDNVIQETNESKSKQHLTDEQAATQATERIKNLAEANHQTVDAEQIKALQADVKAELQNRSSVERENAKHTNYDNEHPISSRHGNAFIQAGGNIIGTGANILKHFTKGAK